MKRIYPICGEGLGDVWASVSHAIQDEPTNCVHIYGKSPFLRKPLAGLITRVADLLDHDKEVVVVEDFPTSPLSHLTIFDSPILPVLNKWRWKGGESVACQLTTDTHLAHCKNCWPVEVKQFIDRYSPSVLGLPRSLEECVADLSRCKLFVGIDSGYAHVNYSVGAPVVLIRNRTPKEFLRVHATKKAIWIDHVGQLDAAFNAPDKRMNPR